MRNGKRSGKGGQRGTKEERKGEMERVIAWSKARREGRAGREQKG